MASFHYKIVHRPGKQHGNTDALSRLPAYVGGKDQEKSAGHILRPMFTVCTVRGGPQVVQNEVHVGGNDLVQTERIQNWPACDEDRQLVGTG